MIELQQFTHWVSFTISYIIYSVSFIFIFLILQYFDLNVQFIHISMLSLIHTLKFNSIIVYSKNRWVFTNFIQRCFSFWCLFNNQLSRQVFFVSGKILNYFKRANLNGVGCLNDAILLLKADLGNCEHKYLSS